MDKYNEDRATFRRGWFGDVGRIGALAIGSYFLGGCKDGGGSGGQAYSPVPIGPLRVDEAMNAILAFQPELTAQIVSGDEVDAFAAIQLSVGLGRNIPVSEDDKYTARNILAVGRMESNELVALTRQGLPFNKIALPDNVSGVIEAYQTQGGITVVATGRSDQEVLNAAVALGAYGRGAVYQGTRIGVVETGFGTLDTVVLDP